MFRPAVLVLTAAAALSGLPLHAQEADGAQRADYQVVGQTPVVCTLTVGTNGSGELVNFRTDDRNVFQIDQMVSAASLSTRAASFALRLDGVCNSAHTVRLESRNNGLWQVSETPPQRPAGFGTAVPYELTARWNDRIFRLSADAGVRGFNRIAVPVEAPAGGEMVLSFDISEGATNAAANAPLVAGAYSDTLTVILEPQQ